MTTKVIEASIKLPKPKGSISIQVGNKSYQEENLFTVYCMGRLTTANATVMNTSAGIFTYCKVGSGTTPITINSTALSAAYAANSTRSNTVLNYVTIAGQRYAQLISTFSFPTGSIVGNITEIMLCPAASNDNMLCGKLLDGAVPVTASEQVVIVYTVRVPIVSTFTQIASGNVTLNGTNTNYVLEAQLHSESATSLISQFPFPTARTSANYSDFYVNSSFLGASNGSYECIKTVNGLQTEYLLKCDILGIVPPTPITVFGFGAYYPGATYSLRFVFDIPFTKPLDLNFRTYVKLTILWEA